MFALQPPQMITSCKRICFIVARSQKPQPGQGMSIEIPSRSSTAWNCSRRSGRFGGGLRLTGRRSQSPCPGPEIKKRRVPFGPACFLVRIRVRVTALVAAADLRLGPAIEPPKRVDQLFLGKTACPVNRHALYLPTYSPPEDRLVADAHQPRKRAWRLWLGGNWLPATV